MKRIVLFASISHLALIASSGAQAAPPRLKPVAVVAAPIYSWTGCYAGAHLGGGWNHQQVTASNFSYGVPSGPVSATNALDTSSGIFGGQAGCNYQFAGNWVVGIQGDIAGADFSSVVADPFDRFNLQFPPGTIGVQTDWIASLTARLGITAWDNRALFYVKGGVAWDRNRWDLSRSSYCAFYSGCLNRGPEETRTGWTAGVGVEWVILPASPNWTAFAEYNFYDFSGNGFNLPVGLIFIDPRNAISAGRQEIQTVKVGINYKFTGP